MDTKDLVNIGRVKDAILWLQAHEEYQKFAGELLIRVSITGGFIHIFMNWYDTRQLMDSSYPEADKEITNWEYIIGAMIDRMIKNRSF